MNILTDSSNQINYFIVAGSKKIGPFSSQQMAEFKLMSPDCQLTESEKSIAQIVPSTMDGQQILFG